MACNKPIDERAGFFRICHGNDNVATVLSPHFKCFTRSEYHAQAMIGTYPHTDHVPMRLVWATVNAVIPSGDEAGLQLLTVRVPDSGSEVTVPIEITALKPVASGSLSDGNAGAVAASPVCTNWLFTLEMAQSSAGRTSRSFRNPSDPHRSLGREDP